MISKKQLKRINAGKHSTTGKPGHHFVSYCSICFRESKDTIGHYRASFEDVLAVKVGVSQKHVTGKCGHTWDLIRA